MFLSTLVKHISGYDGAAVEGPTEVGLFHLAGGLDCL